MERNRPLLRMLTAGAIVLLMAVLPLLTALWQDALTLGTPGIGQLPSVELNIRENLPGLGLLALVDQGKNWNITDVSAARLTEEEAIQTALEALEPYHQKGLLDTSQPFVPYRTELFAVSLPTGLAGVMWSITMIVEKEGIYQAEVDLLLDDATGKLVHINYGGEKRISQGEMAVFLENLAAVFFGQLGIGEYAQAAVDDLEGTYIGESTVAQRYRFGDTAYGEVEVDLFVFSRGFYAICEG